MTPSAFTFFLVAFWIALPLISCTKRNPTPREDALPVFSERAAFRFEEPRVIRG